MNDTDRDAFESHLSDAEIAIREALTALRAARGLAAVGGMLRGRMERYTLGPLEGLLGDSHGSIADTRETLREEDDE